MATEVAGQRRPVGATARMPLLVALACRGCGKRLGAALEGSETRCPRCGRWTVATQAADVTVKAATDKGCGLRSLVHAKAAAELATAARTLGL